VEGAINLAQMALKKACNKFTNQRFAYSGSPPRFSRRSNPPEEAKR